MAGYSGISMSNNAVQAYKEGKKPVYCITKEDIRAHGINESITFFRWFVKKYCRSCEWHHSSPRYNETYFYDIEGCCIALKKLNIEKLKAEFKAQQKQKSDTMLDEKVDDRVYYAKVEFSISTYRGGRKYLDVYAIIYRYWAYYKDDYHKKISKKNIKGGHFNIVQEFESRPDELPEDVANEILAKIPKR